VVSFNGGEPKIVLTIKTPLRGPQGSVIGILGISIDITEQKQSQAELKAAKEEAEKNKIYLENILSNIEGYVYWKDKDGVYQGCNKYAAQHYCVGSPEAIVGKTDYDMPWSAEEAKKLRENDKEIMRSGQACEIEEVVSFNGGEPKIVLTIKTPLRGPQGSVIGILGISIDITERKEAERNSQIKSEMMANLSHDIRTPLSSILCLNDLLLSQCKNEKEKKILQNIKRSAKTIEGYTDQVLSFSKLESPYMVPTPHQFDLVQLIDEEVETLRYQAEQKDLELIWQPEQEALLVSSDPEYLRRIIINLIGNSIRYTQEGSITVSAAYHDSEGFIQIVVTDTGEGVPKVALSGIFDRYKQGCDGGMGLGLSIVQQLTELLGGKITVVSRQGGGTEFNLSIPSA